MVEPLTFTKEGHTYDKTTWSSINPKVSPITRTPFTNNELKSNISLKKILQLFNTIDVEDELIESLTVFFGPEKAATIDDLFVSNHDLLTLEIKNLVKSYNKQFSFEFIPDEDQPKKDDKSFPSSEEFVSLLPKSKKHSKEEKDLLRLILLLKENIRDKSGTREKWFDDNTDTKIAKLQTIRCWFRHNSLNEANKPIIYALIRDVCALKRNSWGLFQPHSLAEFNFYAKRMELDIPENISFSEFQLNQLMPDKYGLIDVLIDQMQPVISI